VRYKGEWKLPQEVELEEARRKAELVEVQWKGNIKRWRGWLQTDKAPKALELIEEINDPCAVPAIKDQLDDEKEYKFRKLWLETLGRIDSPAARSILVEVSLKDANLELRLTAVDELARSKSPDAVNQYVKALKSTDNPTINRAALGLGALQDKTAIGPLIDVLVTTHTTTTTQGNGQSINTTFSTGGNGPSGLSVGSKKQTYTGTFANEDVRNALTRLAGVNFNYEIERWKAWHAAQRQDAAVNVRRD
jgi:HEAT repeat protein